MIKPEELIPGTLMLRRSIVHGDVIMWYVASNVTSYCEITVTVMMSRSLASKRLQMQTWRFSQYSASRNHGIECDAIVPCDVNDRDGSRTGGRE